MFGRSARAARALEVAEACAEMLADGGLSARERCAVVACGRAAQRRAERLDPGLAARDQALREIGDITE